MPLDRKQRQLFFKINCIDKNRVAQVGHDSDGYYFSVFNKDDDDGARAIYSSDDFTQDRWGSDGEMIKGTSFQALSQVLDYTAMDIDWTSVSKGTIRALNQASGVRADEIIHTIAAALETPQEKEERMEERRKNGKRWGLSRG